MATKRPKEYVTSPAFRALKKRIRRRVWWSAVVQVVISSMAIVGIINGLRLRFFR